MLQSQAVESYLMENVKEDQFQFLREVFPGLTDSWLAYISSTATRNDYVAGTVICREGEPGDTFYIIESGTVGVSKRVDGETTHTLAHHLAGEFFGELALVHDVPRSATVTAIEDTSLIEISKENFNEYLAHSPPMAVAIMRAVAARWRDADRRSISELRRKNTELQQTYSELEREVERRSDFLTVISHELRTPLTSVKGYTHLLREGKLQGADYERSIEALTKNFDKIVLLVNNILLLQEIELVVPQMERVVLETLVRDEVEEIAPQARESGLRILTDIEAGLPHLRGDKDSLRKAIGALLDNAIKFSPDGGDIRVKVRREGPHAAFSVRDPGVGIDPEDVKHIFDRIHLLDQKDDNVFGGIGIGLPLVRAVVQHHGGEIDVESTLEEGSTFTIRLPFR